MADGRSKVLKSGGLLVANRIVGQALAFVRNVFVARLLTPADYGLAATFWITTAFLGSITEFGFQQKLIQSKDGDDEHVGAVAQSLFILRGGLIALVLFLTAGPVASIFDATEATWAFRVVALLPLISGFTHRDVDRLKRNLNFRPQVATQLLPEFAITLLAIPVALWTRDYRVFLITSLAKTVLTVLMSHWVAERPFRLGWDREIVVRFMHFGWPLLINSVLMFGMLQGDRMLLAAFYTKEELGVYSLAIALITAVIGLVTSTINPLMLPIMSQVQDNCSKHAQYYGLHLAVMTGIACVVGMAFVLVGPPLIVFLYGSKYAAAALVVGWLGISQAFRLLRMPAANAAMSRGDTRATMIANLFRQIGLVCSFFVAYRGWGMQWIAISAIAGELCAIIAAGNVLSMRHAIPIRSLCRSVALACVCFVAATVLYQSRPQAFGLWSATGVWLLLTLGTLGGLVSLFPTAKQEFKSIAIVLRQWVQSKKGRHRRVP